jgi:hypothetical protein
VQGGYIWTLDKQFQSTRDTGGCGLFDVELHLDEDVGVLFNPAPMFGLEPGRTKTASGGVPTGFAVSWEVRLHGTSMLPGRVPARPTFKALQERRTL